MPFCDCCICCKSKSTRCRMTSVAITSLFLLILGGVFLTIYYALFYAVVKEQSELREGSLLYPEWVEPSQTVYVGFFFMNITNPEEFAAQTPEKFVKPSLQQTGPYVYRAAIKKDGLEPLHNVTPKEIKFRQTFNFYEIPEMTVGSKNDMITTINFLALALGPTLEYLFNQPEYENLPTILKQQIYSAVDTAIKSANSTLLLQYPAGDLLFGFKDPLYSALVDSLNTILNGSDLSHLLPISDEFGIFKILNGSAGWHTFQTYTGDPEYWLTNTITTLDGKKKLDYWFGESCNMINGSDGTVRPPLATREELVYHTYPSACRSTYVKYVRDTTVKRVPAWEYRSPPEMFKAPSNSDYNRCFCKNNSTELYCTHDGGIYLAPCLFGAPLYISAPHFLHGDGYFLSKLDGLDPPNIEEHGTVYEYEPNTGAAIAASKRLQFNIYVRPNDYVDISQKIGDTFVFPIMWVNGTYIVNDEDADLLYGLIVGSFILVVVLQVVLLAAGTGLLIYVIHYYVAIIRPSRKHSLLQEDLKPNEKKEKVHQFTNGTYNALHDLPGVPSFDEDNDHHL